MRKSSRLNSAPSKSDAEPIKSTSAPKKAPQTPTSPPPPTNKTRLDPNLVSNPKVPSPAKTPAKTPAKQPAKNQDMKKVKSSSGSAPVDEHLETLHAVKFRVHVSGGKIYSSTLNQSNVVHNNNKFYILQVVESLSNPKDCYFWSRWGRVGVVGQSALFGPHDSGIAIQNYERKLREKSVSGDYRLVEMNYDEDDNDKKKDNAKDNVKHKPKTTDKEDKEKEKDAFQTSTLPSSVKKLIQLMFDMKMMNQQMKEIGYDAKKMPLGKLAKSSIVKGYEALNSLMKEIKAGSKSKQLIEKFNNDFYSYIPHDFGFMKMQHAIINTEKQVKEKLEMLQSLEDIQVFTKLLDEGKVASDINELDSNYLKLGLGITPVDQSSNEFAMVQRYITNTHASSHTQYKLVLEDLFTLDKESSNNSFRKDVGNVWLLWHGSRLTNYVGILSQGLRIAPPEAPVTGYMFGKGVYFADMVSKSANYCCTNPTNNTGLMLLCEVALGDMNEKTQADYYANLLPPGKSSTKGVGKTAPGSTETMNGVVVPTGLPHAVDHSSKTMALSLLYNEFIVYDINQIRLKYLIRLKFDYRK